MAVTSAHDTFASNSTATEHNQPQRAPSATSSVTNRQIQIARDIQSEENTISRAASTENCRAMHFCLSARRERKSVAVNIGLPELEVRQRFGCPLGGRKVELRVLGRTERGRVEGNHIQIDCHNILSDHLTSTAEIAPRHDGRHLGLVTQALALRTDSLTTNFVRLIRAASLADDEVFLTVLFCKHGRHRSVAVAMLYAILLAILGAEVTLTLPDVRCTCVECDGYSIIELRAGYLDDWIDSINDNLCNYLRSQNTAPPHVRSMLEDIIEFTDYCPIGFDWGV